MAGIMDNIGSLLGLSNRSQVNAGKQAIDDIMQEAMATGATNRRLYGDYLDQMQGIYGQGANQYAAAVDRMSKAIGGTPDTFSYTGNVDDFYDKFANQRQQAVMNTMNQQAAAGGQRWSSDYMNNLAAKQGALASEDYAKAYDKMMQDRQQQLAEWNAGQTAKQGFINNLGTVAGLYGNDRNQIANAISDYYSNVASQNNADLQTRADLTMGKTNLGMQENNGFGSLLGGVGSILGGLFGA